MRSTSGFAAMLLALGASTALAQNPIKPPPKQAGTIPIPSTTVTGATPSSLGLVIGGPKQIVALSGTLLDRITSVSVEKNGVPVNYVAETLLPSTGSTTREIHLTAAVGAPASTTPADLVVKGMFNGAPPLQSLKVPITLNILQRSTLVHRDALFATPINALLAGASTSFTSCGSPAQHVFAVQVPKASYSAGGSVPRLEQVITSPADRATFLLEHSLNPSNMFDVSKLALLATNAHPSPIPHSISEVRMCLEPLKSNSWSFASATQAGSAAEVTVTVRVGKATFRARGMPSDPTGAITGINVNILWGNAITDTELPDYEYSSPAYDVRLPLQIAGGDITYGSVSVVRRQSSLGWAFKFLGPSSPRSLMEQYSANRMNDIAQEIKKAFEAGGTRNAISGAIMAHLQSSHGITDVLGLRLASGGDTWTVEY